MTVWWSIFSHLISLSNGSRKEILDLTNNLKALQEEWNEKAQ